ncbi:tyrosine-protein phosphatase [Streptomyces sp. H27-H5]|uniref:tyrosine-protein phosphatase n=1 Tax=Streptomyces sp. H27-H5 TaxID=2996460 RepID=UPI00226DDDCE|nr:tyrosine-protein phosphatase [Streptomyces sp. H27-H5]MCY0955550.1 tyrosine-protein phosphatase [Streptomyces sp. H27-H5]
MTARHIEFERLHNFRDLGGHRSADGRTVVPGALYRSDSLGKLRGADWDRFLALGIRTVIDLRYPWEADAKGRVPEPHRFTYANLSIEHRPYDQAEIDPDIDPWRHLADRFAEVTEDGVEEIRQAIELIADAEPGPTVFHCTSGKDRTGLIAAFVLTLLDVPEEEILADFARTELATERLKADWHTANPGRTMRWPAYGRAPAIVMELVLADLEARHGSPTAYLTDHVGITPETVARLRARLLTPATSPTPAASAAPTVPETA